MPWTKLSCTYIMVHYCKVTLVSIEMIQSLDSASVEHAAHNSPLLQKTPWAVRTWTQAHLTWVWEYEGICTLAGWGRQQWRKNGWRKQRVWRSQGRSRADGPSESLWAVWTPGGRKRKEKERGKLHNGPHYLHTQSIKSVTLKSSNTYRILTELYLEHQLNLDLD